MSPKNTGAYAKHTGIQLEASTRSLLLRSGYSQFEATKKGVFSKANVFANRSLVSTPQFVVEAIVGETIYGCRRKVDLLVINNDLFPAGLVIECKWQQSKGSVDEKFAYLYLCIMAARIPSIVLLDGGGARPGAIAWFKSHARPNSPLLAVYTTTEFQVAVNNGLLASPPSLLLAA